MGAAQKREPLPINPRVLSWARKRAGKSLEQAARSVKATPDQVAAWENVAADERPTVSQARRLANAYGRAFLEFFLPDPPEIPEPDLIPDFRLYRGREVPGPTRELLDIQIWAETQRTNALGLYEELADTPPEIPETLFATIASDVEVAASRTRAVLNFMLAEQVGLTKKERDKLVPLIRKKIEALGILTLKKSNLRTIGARGFCLAEYPLPVIVFGNELPAAQCFTLGHELAHVLIRQSAISGSMTREGGAPAARQVEDWCNRFAAAFLLPRDAIAQFIALPEQPAADFSDDLLRRIAAHFGVSEHATLIRLVTLSYVRASYYWDIKKPQFDEQEARYKGGGIPEYYGTRYRGALGDLYTSLVIEAWATGRITNHNAAEFMGIKNLAHLRDIREKF